VSFDAEKSAAYMRQLAVQRARERDAAQRRAKAWREAQARLAAEAAKRGRGK